MFNCSVISCFALSAFGIFLLIFSCLHQSVMRLWISCIIFLVNWTSQVCRLLFLKIKAYLILLCIALLCFTDNASFTNWRLWQPGASKSIGAIFLRACAPLASFCHLLGISQYLKHSRYFYVCCGDLLFVVFDVFVALVLGHHDLLSFNTMNINDKQCIFSDCSTYWSFPNLPLS